MKNSFPSEVDLPPFCRSEVYWKVILWFALVVSLTFYLLGSAVSVPWGNTPIPLAQAIDTIRWDKALQVWSRDGQLLTFVAAALCAFAYTMASSRKTRLAAVIVGFAFPGVLMGVGALVSLFFGPIILLGFLSGGGAADGEFYIEEMPQFAAIGVWMLLCLVFAIREIRGVFKTGGKADDAGKTT